LEKKKQIKMSKGRPAEKSITTVVVYKKPTGKKHWMLITENGVDDIINSRKRNPLLPSNYEIVEIGIGESLAEQYKKEYNIK
tara:strand:- start:2291 stop:2536 length:246 start_codon:yes stop_codon:yes gene_type:complete